MNYFFGTDGLRATVGTTFFTHERLPEVAHAFATWINETYQRVDYTPRMIILHDTRNSCAYIKAIIKMAFLSQGITVYDAGVAPTPAATYLIKKYHADCALIISASHNPWHDNGVKIIDRSGKLGAQAELRITGYLQNPKKVTINYAHLGDDISVDGTHEYHDALIDFFKKDFLKGFTVVLDCANGATSIVAPKIFESFGARVIVINNRPNGFNINHECGSVNPTSLQQTVIDTCADIGFAFDGDGDRVIAVNSSGSIKNGDDILALLSRHPDYQDQKNIVGTIMSNVGLEIWLQKYNKKLVRTAVGDKYVAQTLEELAMLLGGEQSGHILLKNYTNTGDALLVGLKVLEAMILGDNRNFETFTPYPQVLLTIPVKKMCDLSENPYDQLIAYAQEQVPLGRVSVRYSGTEKNILRIMVESEVLHEARSIAQHLAHRLQKELS